MAKIKIDLKEILKAKGIKLNEEQLKNLQTEHELEAKGLHSQEEIDKMISERMKRQENKKNNNKKEKDSSKENQQQQINIAELTENIKKDLSREFKINNFYEKNKERIAFTENDFNSIIKSKEGPLDEILTTFSKDYLQEVKNPKIGDNSNPDEDTVSNLATEVEDLFNEES